MSQAKTWTVVIHREGKETKEVIISVKEARHQWFMYNVEKFPNEAFEVACVKEQYFPNEKEEVIDAD